MRLHQWHISPNIDDHYDIPLGTKFDSTAVVLTPNPGFPIQNTFVDILHFQLFSCGTELVVSLKTTDDNGSFFFGQEFRSVREILDDEKR